MFLLYLDGSGVPTIGQNTSTFALLGLSLHEGNWFALEKRVAGLKQRFEYPGIPLELHAKDICCSIAEQDEIPGFDAMSRDDRRSAVVARRAAKLAALSGEKRENARRRAAGTEPVLHLTRHERSTLYEAALDLVGSHKEIRLFAEVVDKAHLLRATGKRSSVAGAFEQVISRFDAYLQFLARSDASGLNNGIAVVDVDPNSELMRDLTVIFRARGHRWGQLQHVIETPFFVDSKTVSGIQLADICGYALRRYVEKANRAGSHEEKQFSRIFHKFDRAGVKLHGLRHYCAAGSCDCMICGERGH